MIDDWFSYRVADFVPFTAEVYFRLIERVGETFWPMHLLTVAMGLATLILVLRGRGRIACLLLAVVWGWVGITFMMQRYAQLNWAGEYFGWGFLMQAALLALIAWIGHGLTGSGRPRGVPGWTALALTVVGLVLYPFIAPLAGYDGFQAETFGIHPDPTAVATLGIVLLALDGGWRWLAILIPVFWCLISALTLQVLDAPWAMLLHAIAVLAATTMIWKLIADVVRARKLN